MAVIPPQHTGPYLADRLDLSLLLMSHHVHLAPGFVLIVHCVISLLTQHKCLHQAHSSKLIWNNLLQETLHSAGTRCDLFFHWTHSLPCHLESRPFCLGAIWCPYLIRCSSQGSSGTLLPSPAALPGGIPTGHHKPSEVWEQELEP